MTVTVGIVGTDARWRPAEPGELEDYALPKCPECGRSDIEVCVNWKPEPGLDQSMKLVRCIAVSKEIVVKQFENGVETAELEHTITRCHAEYFLAPVLGHGAKSRGTLL